MFAHLAPQPSLFQKTCRMDITVNHQTYSFPETLTLQQMLDSVLGQQDSGIAMAVNQEIISRDNWQTYHLKTGDNVTIIKATQGG